MPTKKTTRKPKTTINAYRVQSWFDGIAAIVVNGVMTGTEHKPPGWVDRGTYPERKWADKRARQIQREEKTKVEVVPLSLKPAQHAQLPGVRKPPPPKSKRARDTLKKGQFLLQERVGGKWLDRDTDTRNAALRRRDINQKDGYLFRVVDHAGHVIEPNSDREFAADEA